MAIQAIRLASLTMAMVVVMAVIIAVDVDIPTTAAFCLRLVRQVVVSGGTVVVVVCTVITLGT